MIRAQTPIDHKDKPYLHGPWLGCDANGLGCIWGQYWTQFFSIVLYFYNLIDAVAGFTAVLAGNKYFGARIADF